MSKESKAITMQKPGISADALSKLMLHGDLKALTPAQKVEYYGAVCESVGLSPLTKPFDYIILNGKEVLYANKGCGEQLRQVHGISLKIPARELIGDVYIVTADANTADGRTDSATGCVSVANLRGDALANAYMKAETKAKRRVTLSICGLNMLDETEVETIPNAKPSAQESFVPQGKDSKPEKEESPKTVVTPKEPPAQAFATPADLAKQVLAASKELGMSTASLKDFIHSETGKPSPKDLTYSEMEKILAMLQHEVGRK